MKSQNLIQFIAHVAICVKRIGKNEVEWLEMADIRKAEGPEGR